MLKSEFVVAGLKQCHHSPKFKLTKYITILCWQIPSDMLSFPAMSAVIVQQPAQDSLCSSCEKSPFPKAAIATAFLALHIIRSSE
jgi:hypothetical protein